MDRFLGREEVMAAINALPLIKIPPIQGPMEGTTALAILAELEDAGSTLPQSVREQIVLATDSVASELNLTPDLGHYVVSPDELRGIIARAMVGSAALTALVLGVGSTEGHNMNKSLHGPDDTRPKEAA